MNTELAKKRDMGFNESGARNMLVKNTRMADYNQKRLDIMSSKGLQDSIAKEKAKLSLIKKRVSSLKQQLKNKMKEQQRKMDYFKREGEKLSASKMTKTTLRKMKQLTKEAKNYAASTTDFKLRKYDEMKDLEKKANKIESNINALEKKWLMT